MNNRRDAMRVAGWVAMISGLVAMVLGVVVDDIWAQAAGAYGLLFALTGTWTVGGLAVLSRYERRTAMVNTASRIVADPRESVSH